MLFTDGSINKQKEIFSFTVRFEFNNFKDANIARKKIGKYYKCATVRTKTNISTVNKEERLNFIVNVMKSDIQYSPGKLYRSIGRHVDTGYKTFQRDISTLIILHKIKRLQNNQLIKEAKQ